MKLYVLRHAMAVERESWRGADRERPLTPEGIRKMKQIASGLRELDLGIDWILASPYRRAYDTAALAARKLKLRKKLRVSKTLAPDGSMTRLIRKLALDYRTGDSVMVVGHEPYLGRLIAMLTTGQTAHPITLRNGGLARLSADALAPGPCATLDWVLTPKLLRNFE